MLQTHSQGCTWEPLISPDSSIGKSLDTAVNCIAKAIKNKEYPPLPQTPPRDGTYEAPLLFAYLARAGKPGAWKTAALEQLNVAVEQADELVRLPGLFGGLAGLGWIAEHVSRLLAESTPGDIEDEFDLNSDIDDRLLQILSHRPWSGEYDLISGLVGFGVYFLERLPRDSAKEGLRLIVATLLGNCERSMLGITWHTRPELLTESQRAACPDGYYNLGVAHGIPGIIHFLSQCLTVGIETGVVSELLDGAIAWLLAHQHTRERASSFSSWIASGYDSDARFAWCYGDPGITCVLMDVARRFPRSRWTLAGRQLLDHCLSRASDQSGVNDAPLCHGAIGLAHIFNRIYHMGSDERCRTAAIEWYGRAFEMLRPDCGVGGVLTRTRPQAHGPIVWEASPGFLSGAIGVALGMLAAISPIEPMWDRMLLLSGPRLDVSNLPAER